MIFHPCISHFYKWFYTPIVPMNPIQWLWGHRLDCKCGCRLLVTEQNTLTTGGYFFFSVCGSRMKMLWLCAQRQISACVDVIIISFLLTLLQYWSCHSFHWDWLWFKLVNVISAFVTIAAEYHLLSMKYSKFFYYIFFWHPQHGSTTGFESLLITDCFLPYRFLWAFVTWASVWMILLWW